MAEGQRSQRGHWSLRTVPTSTETRLEGWRLIGDRLLRNGSGRLLWIPNPPTRREDGADGPFHVKEVDWSLTDSGGEVVLRASADGALVDLIELGPEGADAFLTDSSEPMAVQPLGVAIGGPPDLGSYLVGGRVVVVAEGRAWPTEQVALSLYRIARLRGGPFWDSVADHLADAVAARIEEAGPAGPVQDFWGRGESHVRLLADAVLLLVARAELSGDERLAGAVAKAADQLAAYGVPWGGGVWYLHDSLEREAGRNDLVLNTHVHGMLALTAAGRSVGPARDALAAALSLRCRRTGAYLHAAAMAAGDLASGWAPGPGSRAGRRLARSAEAAAAAYRARYPHLRSAAGRLARDVGGEPAHSRYLLINLYDLAMLVANGAGEVPQRALRQGLRYGEASGYVRGEWRSGDPAISALYPTLLRAVGPSHAARRAAERALARGSGPAIGWPGFEDALWSRLAEGTP